MSEQDLSLEQELILGGADLVEARELAGLAGRLPELRQLPLVQTPPSLQVGQRVARRRQLVRRSSRVAVFAGVLSGAVIAAAIVVVAAQLALPGAALYPVKRASEAVAVTLQPSFSDNVMMRRADEVNELIAKGSNTQLISATLSSYDKAVTQDPAESYAARDYCAGMLKSAAVHADPATRAQIMGTVSHISLDRT